MKRFPARAWQRWNAPVPAFPIDIFRVLVGLLSAVYFTHLAIQTGDISSPDGLIDHALTREIFWYTKMGLFQPGLSAGVFQLIFVCAAAASLLLAAGWRPKLMAAVMFVTAVSAYRWNFLVIYVDDAIMHLAIFWMLLLPIGATLAPGTRRSQWRSAHVPGGAVRALLINLTLVYVVAGLWKWTSPMWRSGTALFAALQTPVARIPDMWTESQLPLISLADYVTLVLEPVFPLMFVLRRNHPAKWALLVMMVGFHIGIIATMKVPYANIACLAAVPLFFRDEIMSFVNRGRTMFAMHIPRQGSLRCSVISLAFVLILALAMAGEAAVPAWRGPNRPDESSATVGRTTRHAGFLGTQHNPMYMPLWGIGIAQSYRLFDWIDDRNFRVDYRVTEFAADGSRMDIDPEVIFPASIRGVLLQTYIHDVTWASVPRERADEIKIALLSRFARRYCRAHGTTGEILVSSAVGRVSINGPAPLPPPRPLIRFGCEGNEERVAFMQLSRGRVVFAAPPRINASLAVRGAR